MVGQMRMTVRILQRKEGQNSVRDVPASHPDAQMLKVKNNSQRVQGILIPTSKKIGTSDYGKLDLTIFLRISIFPFRHVT